MNEIGGLLNYHSKTEWPIPGTGKHPQAIDLCWFFDESQDSPLFAFEIESKDTAAAQGNANKLFAKNTSQMQKPLFFFHLFLDGPEEDTRKDDLRSLFGTLNYCVYDLVDGSLTEVLLDVLRQHRRLTDRILIFDLVKFCDSTTSIKVDLKAVVDQILSLEFEKGYGTTLGELGHLLLCEIDVRIALSRVLQQRFQDEETEEYGTWLSSYVQEIVHWAILCSLDDTAKDRCVQRIMQWQFNSGHMNSIGPYFGLDREYDCFVICWAPAVWALVAGLCNSTVLSGFICTEIDTVCKAIENSSFACYLPYLGLWMLKIALCDHKLERFSNRAKQLISQNGGIAEQAWIAPPGVLPLEEGSEFPCDPSSEFTKGTRLDVSLTNEVIRRSYSRFTQSDNPSIEALTCAFQVLINENGLHDAGWKISNILNNNRCKTDQGG